MEKKDDINLHSILTGLEMRAIEMRYEGYNMREISDAIQEQYTTVRLWFSKNGKLYEFYTAYATEESEKRRKDAHTTFKAHLQNAVRVLVEVMNKSKFDPARVQAAKEIINRELGEPIKPIEMVDPDRVNEYLAAAQKLDEIIHPDDSRRKSADAS